MKPFVTFIGAAVAAAVFAFPALAEKNLNTSRGGPSSQAAPGDLGMAIMSAAINSDGTIARGEGVVSAANLGTGFYEVSFGRDITNCTYQISPGESVIGSATPRLVGITRRSGDNNGVFVTIKDAANAAIDNPFFVLVYCGR